MVKKTEGIGPDMSWDALLGLKKPEILLLQRNAVLSL